MLFSQFILFDVLSVTLISTLAVAFLARSFLKFQKNKCTTFCGGCTAGSCGVKSFSVVSQSKKVGGVRTITIHPKKN